jgi:hypothetical protein
MEQNTLTKQLFSLPRILSTYLFSLVPTYRPLTRKFYSSIACKVSEVRLKQTERDEVKSTRKKNVLLVKIRT